jgi:hypothetical protein
MRGERGERFVECRRRLVGERRRLHRTSCLRLSVRIKTGILSRARLVLVSLALGSVTPGSTSRLRLPNNPGELPTLPFQEVAHTVSPGENLWLGLVVFVAHESDSLVSVKISSIG